MARILTISVAVASFLVVPALCVGGVIMHACDCVKGTCCPPERDCNGRSGCGHESGCSDDPCSVRVVRPERQNAVALTVFHPAVSTAIILVTVTQPSVQTERAGTQEWPDGKKLPFRPNDLPLLI